ncbi:hypothetical protein AgCh_020456 [Apium graveolens]
MLRHVGFWGWVIEWGLGLSIEGVLMYSEVSAGALALWLGRVHFQLIQGGDVSFFEFLIGVHLAVILLLLFGGMFDQKLVSSKAEILCFEIIGLSLEFSFCRSGIWLCSSSSWDAGWTGIVPVQGLCLFRGDLQIFELLLVCWVVVELGCLELFCVLGLFWINVIAVDRAMLMSNCVSVFGFMTSRFLLLFWSGASSAYGILNCCCL